jgi:hypothetical protein
MEIACSAYCADLMAELVRFSTAFVFQRARLAETHRRQRLAFVAVLTAY